jgi:hypothetical protein
MTQSLIPIILNIISATEVFPLALPPDIPIKYGLTLEVPSCADLSPSMLKIDILYFNKLNEKGKTLDE